MSYNATAEFHYCKNAISEGYIPVSQIESGVLELSALSGADPILHSMCEWQISTKQDKPVKVTIKRQPENYEDIFIYAATESSNYVYASKNLTAVENNEINLVLTRIKYLRIRVKILNDLSTYSITIKQEPQKEEEETSISLLILITVICA